MDELVSIAIEHDDGKKFSTVVAVDQYGEFNKIEKTSDGYSVIAGLLKRGKLSVGIIRLSPSLAIGSYEQYFGFANRACLYINRPGVEIPVWARTKKIAGSMPVDDAALSQDEARAMTKPLALVESFSKAFFACIHH